MALESPEPLVPETIRAVGVQLLADHDAALRRVIQRYVRDPNTVDDLMQEVGMKVLRRLHTVRDPAAMRGWLFQVARNACLDYLRREDRRPQGSPAPLPDQSAHGDLGRNPADHLLSRERMEAVYRGVQALPNSQREVIRLRIDEGLDHAAIAERLGISRQAVEVRLCRGRATLRRLLDDMLEGDL